MSAAVDRVLAALEDHGCGPRQNGNGWSARCPLHDDRKPSLSVDTGDDGRALVFCHVCGREATPQLVEAIGLRLRDLHSDNGQRRGNGQAQSIVATYDYVDESGELLYQVVRLHPKDFRQRRPDGAGGFIWNLRGVPRVLYRLPELVKSPSEAVVFDCEGEKDCDRLADVGLIATCCPGGAGKWSRLSDDSTLEGRRVVILPDNDEPGRRHAEAVACRLHGRAASVRVLHLPDLPEHGDVSDWLDAGGDPEDLDQLAQADPEWAPTPEPPDPPYAGEQESMAGLRAAASTSEDLRLGAMRLCDRVAEWFARRGPETLGKDFPIPYAAAALGVTRVHLYRLRDVGRVRLALGCNPVGYNLDDTTDRALRPLTPLLGRSPDEIGPAWAMAQELADADAAEKAQRNGRRTPKRARVEARHVRQAIGQDRAGEKIPRASTPSEIARRLAVCLDAVTATPDTPLDVLRPLRTARDNARTWAKGGDR